MHTQRLHEAVLHARHWLPSQNPLRRFVHHNPLHGLEGQQFRDAVERAALVYGARPWNLLSFYRDAYARGRILDCDIDDVIKRELPDAQVQLPGLRLSTQRSTRLLMLAPDTGLHHPEASAWWLNDRRLIEELPTGLDRSSEERLLSCGEPRRVLRDLWQASAAHAAHASTPSVVRRLHAEFSYRTGEDLDALVEPTLIRWVTAYLDLGQARWGMPNRNAGFLNSILNILDRSATALLPGGRFLRGEARRILKLEVAAEDVVLASLQEIGVNHESLDAFVLDTLLALPGIGGMFVRLGERPDLAPAPTLPATPLMELLAVRLLLERAAARHLLSRLGTAVTADKTILGILSLFRIGRRDPDAEFRRIAPVFHVALTLGIRPIDMRRACPEEVEHLLRLGETDSETTLRWLWQLAYERRYRVQVLDSIVVHNGSTPDEPTEAHTQVVCCIDDREESLRRYIEEEDDAYETFGYAGFFGLPIRFHPATGGPASALCPASMAPTHALVEEISGTCSSQASTDGPQRTRSGGSRTRRGVLNALLGPLTLLQTAVRLLRPEARTTQPSRRGAKHETELNLLREDESTKHDGLPLGFTEDEMARHVERPLREMGIASRFSPLVVLLGHESSGVNNPHEAGYNCGACSGGGGGPNARAFAAMCNRPGVRLRLAEAGVHIPETTHFVGGLHNTATDEITLFDIDKVPASHGARVQKLRSDLAHVSKANAKERCRRFYSAPRAPSGEQALRHVVGRTGDLAQARPEYNHVTNAACVVGRRALSRGLFLDRRAFLVSYDPAQDATGQHLTSLLAAAGPVGAGINLEYFFSFVDNERYGAGTKLPQNVVSNLAVMNGSSSDFRTGLVEQMVEIHEPVRLLVIVEGTPDAVAAAAAENPAVKRLVDNRWILVATFDPASGQAMFLEASGFEVHRVEANELPTVATSESWYSGSRECLAPAVILRPSSLAETAVVTS